MVGSNPSSCAIIFDEAGRQRRWIEAVAGVTERTRHAGRAASARVIAFPRHVRMGLTDPSATEAAHAVHAERTILLKSKGAALARPQWPVKFVRDEISAPATSIVEFSTSHEDSVEARRSRREQGVTSQVCRSPRLGAHACRRKIRANVSSPDAARLADEPRLEIR